MSIDETGYNKSLGKVKSVNGIMLFHQAAHEGIHGYQNYATVQYSLSTSDNDWSSAGLCNARTL